MDGLFDKLEKEKGSSLTNTEKANVLKLLDIPKNDEGYYLDAFGNSCSYKGIRTLKRPYTKLPLTQDHLTEIQKCSEDLFYFVRNYCRIITPFGVNFPEFRQYQIDFLKSLSAVGDNVSSIPRQCVAGETEIIIDGIDLDENYKIIDAEIEQSIEKVFNSYTSINELLDEKDGKIELENNNPEFIKSYCFKENIKTDKGFIEASEIHKTIKYDIYEIELENGLKLRASEKHVVIDKDYNEIYIKDCLGKELITKDGVSKVISKKFIRNDHCYDITLSKHHLYYTNGILSHNSGKSVTVGLYTLHYALFNKDKYVGICGNTLGLAREVLDKIKKIFVELPIWLQQGLVAWNKTYIELENGTKIMTAAANEDAFRGYSMNLLIIDEAAYIENWNEFADSVFPAQAALVDKKKILISTPNGMNSWYHIVQSAKREDSAYNYFTMDWRDVPRYSPVDGSRIDPEDFKMSEISTNGRQYFAQNYELAFLGSSNTLIESTALQNLIPQDEDQIIFNSLFSGLRIFEKPIDGHSYIIGVDPAKEGIDKTAIQVLDVTVLPFKQVACANLDDSYLTIPAKLFDLGQYYNWAMVVVENNIDNSIVDNLSFNYEYEGEIFRERGKNLLGFRTTTKTKKQMLSLLKKLIEEDKFKIADKATIDELFVFVQQKNGSFSAQDGYHDDLVMALCIALVPFLNVKRFDDFKGFIELIEKRNEEIKKEEESFLELYLDLGLNNSTPRNNSTNFSEPIIYTDSNPFGFKY